MASAILKAHYDGGHIVLNEAFELPRNAPPPRNGLCSGYRTLRLVGLWC